MAIRVASIGECMIELRHRSPVELDLAYGGDTLNTAVYLARLARERGVAVDYVTALGDDAYSDGMLALWQAERVGTGLVARLPGRLPGLYTIRVDERGERSFTYWRSNSAARDMLKDGRAERLGEALAGYDLLYLSGHHALDPRSAATPGAAGDRRCGPRGRRAGRLRQQLSPGRLARARRGAARDRRDAEADRHRAADARGRAGAVRGAGRASTRRPAASSRRRRGRDQARAGGLLSVLGRVHRLRAGRAGRRGGRQHRRRRQLQRRLPRRAPARRGAEAAARLGCTLAARVIAQRGAIIPAEAMADVRLDPT